DHYHGGTAAAEPFHVDKASPTLVTSASAGGLVGSTSLSDSATLSGGFLDTGAITFTLTLPDSSTLTVGSVSVTGNGIYSSATGLATEVGTYTWHASYSGDGNNKSAIDNGVNESATTTKATPSISTVASGAGVVGTAITSDTASLVGGFSVGTPGTT